MATPDTNDTSEIMRRIGKELPRMRVLLVDRHASARNTLRMILSTLGITAVHNAASTIEVMRQVKAYSFEIIFTDYHLDDGRDGQQLLEELRQLRLISLSTVISGFSRATSSITRSCQDASASTRCGS